MLSRVADSLYWMSRYLERAEHTARLLDVCLNLMLDESPDAGLGRLGHLLEGLRFLPAQALAELGDASSLTQSLTFDHSNRSSIVSSIAASRENLRNVREQISSEMWLHLNRLYLEITQNGAEKILPSQPHEFFRIVREGAHLFQGVTDSTMTHGEGWQFIQLGRFIERAGAIAALVDVHFRRFQHPPDQMVEAVDYLEWVGLLKGCTAFEAYCKVYTAQLRPHLIAEFLVLNPGFPHSVRFSVERVRRAVEAIGETTGTLKTAPLSRLAGRLQATLSFHPMDEIMAAGLHTYLEGILQQCNQMHSAIQEVYVAYPIESVMGV